VNQLPPVEYGAPLRDAIEAGLPYGELREIRRNAGSIVRVCAAIRDDQPWQCDDKPEIDDKTPADGIPRNLVHVPAGSGNADKVVVDLIQKIRKSEKYDPTWDVQVVVAVNDRSAVSRKKLNPLLQIECNPDGKIVPGCQYRVGDKTIMLANSMLIECDRFGVSKGGDNKVPVCNGEFGRILDVSKKKIICQFENPRRIVMVPRGTAEGGENASFDLGFSATVHKMQGSSAKIVIVVIDEYAGATGSFGICDRAWLYTAISRAEQCCFVVGKLSTMKAICKRQYIYRRKTFTVELIREELAARGVDASSFRASEAMRLSVEEESEFVVGMDGFRTDSREVAMAADGFPVELW
jgi:ATP-dependent exoDNAse (exonuclease V) alpha subunit